MASSGTCTSGKEGVVRQSGTSFCQWFLTATGKVMDVKTFQDQTDTV